MLDIVKELDIDLLQHPPYSPDLTTFCFWVFPNLESRLHGQKCESREELRCAVNSHLQEMLHDGLQHMFQCGMNGGIKCKFCQGLYLKGSRGQRYVGIVSRITEFVHEIIDGPSYLSIHTVAASKKKTKKKFKPCLSTNIKTCLTYLIKTHEYNCS